MCGSLLRQDTTSRFERVTLPVPRPGWRQRLSDWSNEAPPRPSTQPAYEFSVGKYTPTGERAKTWKFLRISVEDYLEAAETQKVTPVLVMKSITGKRWWWYLDRFYWEDEQLNAPQLHRRILELDSRKREQLERARRAAANRSPATVYR